MVRFTVKKRERGYLLVTSRMMDYRRSPQNGSQQKSPALETETRQFVSFHASLPSFLYVPDSIFVAKSDTTHVQH